MKRLFVFCLLLLAFVFSSCNFNNTARQKASVEFTIPVTDILALNNNSARNSGLEGEGRLTKILVQLKSDKYYTSKLEIVNAEDVYLGQDLKYYTSLYAEYYKDLQAFFEEYNLTEDVFFSDKINSFFEENEKLLESYIELLNKNHLTQAAAIYRETKGQQLTAAQGAIIAQEFESTFSKNVSFVFDDIEPGNYTVLVDIFDEEIFVPEGLNDDGNVPQSHSEVWWFYTGQQSVNVIAGQDNPVNVEIDEFMYDKQDICDIEITYEEDGQTKTLITNNAGFSGSDDYETGNHIAPKYEIRNFGGKICFRETSFDRQKADDKVQEGDQEPYVEVQEKDWLEVKALDYIINDDFHLAKGFVHKVRKTSFGKKQNNDFGEPAEEIFEFVDNKIDMLEQLKADSQPVNADGSSYSGPEYSLESSQKFESGEEFIYSLPLNVLYCEYEEVKTDENDPSQGGGENTDPVIEETDKTFTEDAHGSLLNTSVGADGVSASVTLTFEKRPDSNPPRYIYEQSLSEMLSGKTLARGDTVVFVMKLIPAENKPADFNSFYYELQKSDWRDLTDDELYDGNEYIGVDNSSVPEEGYYTFVMPFNFIENPKDYDTVLFFFDGYEGDTAESKALQVKSLDYHIFPAESKTFAFKLGKNYDDNNPYRYELEKPLANADDQIYELEEGETVSVTISGTVKAYKKTDSGFEPESFSTPEDTFFKGEIFDNADYASSENSDWQTYHPLSNDRATINTKKLTIRNGEFSDSGTYLFGNIQKPYFDKLKDVNESDLPDHIYKFQCTSSCPDPSVLLVIEDYDLSITVE